MIESHCFMTERWKSEPPRTNDARTPYSRDYSRLVHSSAFRRLQSKTQVYGLGDGDFYRTRLTHSIEVQQIAWSIVSVLKADESTQSNGWELYLPSASLISTVCLAHDLGHPPFGHSGEEVLHNLMEEAGGFDANAQTFRILTRLEKYVEGFGMNLTRRTLLGVLKYPFPKADFPDRENKFIFAEDNKALTFVLGGFSKNDQKIFKTPDDDKLTNMSLDATIMDLADEIAYTIHDLEDAAVLGLLDKQRWEDFVQEKRAKFQQHVSLDLDKMKRDIFSDNHLRKNVVGDFVNTFVTNVKIERKGHYESPFLDLKVVLPRELNEFRRGLGAFTREVVFDNPQIKRLEHKGAVFLREIFQALRESKGDLLPETTRAKYAAAEKDSLQTRVICDYISGMTDVYASDLYATLFTPDRGSVYRQI